jgi:hypothetical protein
VLFVSKRRVEELKVDEVEEFTKMRRCWEAEVASPRYFTALYIFTPRRGDPRRITLSAYTTVEGALGLAPQMHLIPSDIRRRYAAGGVTNWIL